jgi:hypothetical protein
VAEDFFFEMVEPAGIRPELKLDGEVLSITTRTKIKKIDPPKAAKIIATPADPAFEPPGRFQIKVFLEAAPGPEKPWIPGMKLGEEIVLYGVVFRPAVPENPDPKGSLVIYGNDRKKIRDWVTALAKLLEIDAERVVVQLD